MLTGLLSQTQALHEMILNHEQTNTEMENYFVRTISHITACHFSDHPITKAPCILRCNNKKYWRLVFGKPLFKGASISWLFPWAWFPGTRQPLLMWQNVTGCTSAAILAVCILVFKLIREAAQGRKEKGESCTYFFQILSSFFLPVMKNV